MYLKVNMKANADETTWTIGELAAKVGLHTHVLRHWESIGLLTPDRGSSGYRIYRSEHLIRVLMIQSNKAAGMTLEQIGVLLDATADSRHEILHEHLHELDRRVRELERSREMTEHALRCKAHDRANCPRFKAIVADLLEPGTILDSASGYPMRSTTPQHGSPGPAAKQTKLQ